MKSSQHLVLIPGAWMGAWTWLPIMPKLEAAGFQCSTITLSGADGEGEAEQIELESHVQEVIEHVNSVKCDRVSLIGHSYSGIVATLAAIKLGRRVRSLVMIEAFLPEDGKSPLESFGLDAEHERSLVKGNSGRWPHPTREELLNSPHLKDVTVDWVLEHFADHPGKTVSEVVHFDGDLESLNVLFIGKNFPAQHVGLLKSTGWTHVWIDAGHWPMLAEPDTVASIIVANFPQLSGEPGSAEQPASRSESKRLP